MTKHEELLEMISVPTDDCIAWPYAANRGYGVVVIDRKTHYAHRLALSTVSEPPTEKHQAAHGPCHNRACVNPLHLSWKTATENQADKRRDGTHLEGEAAPACTIPDVDVALIRSLYKGPQHPRRPKTGPTQSELANQFGCDQTTISDIVNYKIRVA